MPIRITKLTLRLATKSLGMPLLLIKGSKKVLNMKDISDNLRKACLQCIIKDKPVVVGIMFETYHLAESK